MPISIGTSLPSPFVPPPTRQYDYSYAEWVTPDERRYPLTFPDRGYFLTQGVAGLGSVPLTFTIDPLPGSSPFPCSSPGTRPRSISSSTTSLRMRSA
jgi:hypothetical protein